MTDKCWALMRRNRNGNGKLVWAHKGGGHVYLDESMATTMAVVYGAERGEQITIFEAVTVVEDTLTFVTPPPIIVRGFEISKIV